jgi:hypothetical protein
MDGARRRSRRAVATIVLGSVAGLVLALIATWSLFLRDVAEPTTVGDAVTNFREGTPQRPAAPSPVPEGVYVYATDGVEKTDALTGITHRYPSRSTITVAKAPCGVSMRWDVLKGRSTVWTYCVGSDGWTLESQEERHTFFGRTEHTDYSCPRAPFRPTGDRLGTAFLLLCSTGAANEHGRGRVVGRPVLLVAAIPVNTVHVRKMSTFTGAIRGQSTYDFWLARSTGVPVRVRMVSETTNDSAVGDVHYEERVTLALTSLEPRR